MINLLNANYHMAFLSVTEAMEESIDKEGINEKVLTEIKPIEAISSSELEDVRAFIIKQRKKKEAAEARRKRSIAKASNTISKPASTKKLQGRAVPFDAGIKNIETEAMMDYDDEEDDSDNPDPNEIVDLGDNEEEYKKMKSER
ncbi:unnamed protein product [Meloidogyne enterolobii]|uniref:Uncharacterized protein n=1 Tax=Meloidogyne enterolobii TaxID=390850 RepID=A0ACB0ZX97_MELEN